MLPVYCQERVYPRRVGNGHLVPHAISQLKLDERMRAQELKRYDSTAAMGTIAACMATSASELATYSWLQQRSGLGELTGYDFEGMGLDRLHQVSDLFWKHHAELEAHCYRQELALFQIDETITF